MKHGNENKIADIANNLTNSEICELINAVASRIDIYFGLFNMCCLTSDISYACMNGTTIQINCATAEYDDLKDWNFFQHAMKKQNDLPNRDFGPSFDLPALHRELDKIYLEKALAQCEGNQTKAARLVNLSQQTFNNRLYKAQNWGSAVKGAING